DRNREELHRLYLAPDRHGLARADEQGRRSAVARDPERPVVVAVDAGPRETGPEEHTPVIQDLHAGWRGVAEDHAVRESWRLGALAHDERFDASVRAENDDLIVRLVDARALERRD